MFHVSRALPGLVAGVATIVLLSGCAAAEPTPSGQTQNSGTGETDWDSVEPVELTVSSNLPLTSTGGAIIDNWMKEVTEATDGQVTFEYFGDSTLHPAQEGLSAMTSGLTDITLAVNGYWPDQLPVAYWDDIAVQTALNDFGYPNLNIAGIGQQVVHRSNPDSAANIEQAAAGFVPLVPMLSGPQALTCTEPFETPADLAGRTVRVPYPIAGEELAALGMTGIFLPTAEQYEALQRGVIDCALNATTTVLSAGILDVAPWVSFPNTGPSTGAMWAISKQAWDELVPEVQAAMLDARLGPLETFARDTLDEYAGVIDAADKAGGGIVDATELNPPIADYWAGRPDLVETAPETAADPAAEVERTDAIAEAWWDFTVNELGVPAGDDADILEVLSLGSDVIDADGWAAWRQAIADNLGDE